jgi:hypothetical protein
VANVRVPASPPATPFGRYGAQFRYDFVPAGSYCVEIREVMVLGVDDCGCFKAGMEIADVINYKCTDGHVCDERSNFIDPANPPPRGCTTLNTQHLQCRAKGSNDPWMTFATNEHSWFRNGRADGGDIQVAVIPMGGAPVVSPPIPYP